MAYLYKLGTRSPTGVTTYEQTHILRPFARRTSTAAVQQSFKQNDEASIFRITYRTAMNDEVFGAVAEYHLGTGQAKIITADGNIFPLGPLVGTTAGGINNTVQFSAVAGPSPRVKVQLNAQPAVTLGEDDARMSNQVQPAGPELTVRHELHDAAWVEGTYSINNLMYRL